MARPVPSCPTCGAVVETAGLGKLVSSDTATCKVDWERRIFRGHCPDHGPFDDDETPKQPGHHSTLWASRFRSEFPKPIEARLRRLLSADEWRAYLEMREGRRRADWGWLSGLKQKVA